MTSASLTDPERTELLALYQVTTQDLVFFKSQQWTLTNYSLLALAALAGIRQLSGLQITSCTTVILCLAAGLITFANAFVLWRLNDSIVERRARLDRIFKLFSEEFRKARGDKKGVSSWEIVLPLWVVLSVAFALVLWILTKA